MPQKVTAFTGWSPAPYERYRIDLDKQRRRADVRRSVGVEHVGFSKRKFFRLETCWVLVEQIAEICCRLMSRGNCKEHKLSLVDRQWLGSTWVKGLRCLQRV